MDAVITVEHLRKKYGSNVAVEDVSFEVGRHEIFGILGPNGAGKTTTVECLQGLRRADGGDLRVLGLDPRTGSNEIRRRVGSQLQASALPDRMKVWEALHLYSSLRPGGPPWTEVLDEWGLSGKRDSVFGSLSGGQRQRLFVALALVSDPEIVFLDEMTTGLDPAARRVAWDLVRRIRDRGATVVLVTHFMDEAEMLCDRLAVIHTGTVIDTGSPQELIERHAGVVEVTFTDPNGDLEWLEGLAGVQRAVREGGTVTVFGSGPVLAYVAAGLVERGTVPADLDVRRATLEDVYLRLTGSAAEQ